MGVRINGKCQGQCKGDGVVQGFQAVRRDFPSPVQGPLRTQPQKGPERSLDKGGSFDPARMVTAQ